MKKVFIIHGHKGKPNGAWRPWLMAKLEEQDIYACALSMHAIDEPICDEWVQEISRHIDLNKDDQIYLVGHSLGVSAILRYLEKKEAKNIYGAVLVSGPSEKNNNRKIDDFLETSFNFKNIKSKCKSFHIIHGDNDMNVPLNNAEALSKELNGKLTIVKNGGHLNGSAGWLTLPQCLEALNDMLQ